MQAGERVYRHGSDWFYDAGTLCHECGAGPYAGWQSVCTECSHEFCMSCVPLKKGSDD